MPLPELTESGDLPRGVHKAALSEVIERFSQAFDRRKVLALRLKRIHRVAVATEHLVRFVVFGSFVTAKAQPNDVDVFMIMADDFAIGKLVGESRLLFEHTAAQTHFGCSVFWVRRAAAMGGEEEAIEDWQIKRDGNRRGIVDVIGERG